MKNAPSEKRGWARNAADLHHLIGTLDDMPARLLTLADALVGAPYSTNPLGGGPGIAEELHIKLDAFDCVTFIESVMCLARSATARGFATELRQTRYRNGQVGWQSRLHYFSDWMRANAARGAIRIRSRGAGSKRIETRLDAVAGVPPSKASFHVVPKQKINSARRRLSECSIVAFASVRATLDFFHTGLLFSTADREDPGMRNQLYHASRSKGRVLVEPLEDFTGRNRMRGIAFAGILSLERLR